VNGGLKKMFRISQLLGFSRKNIFADISGHDDVKWAFDRALTSQDPIHILLKGPVGTGKTRFIKAIEKRYPELSYFALGSGATGAGMINQCFEILPRFLLIDEIDNNTTIRPGQSSVIDAG
jgi:DNA replicative helicase MCM subunit Mcm2 (Cdc46/Mcm family)